MPERLLEITDLRVHFRTDEGMLPAVNGVSFHMHAGETLAIVGESGCGKSTVARSIMRLIPSPPGRFIPGSKIMFRGEDLLAKRESDMYKIRGKEISMIFQEPMTSLNPVYTVGYQIAEVFGLHQGMHKKVALEKAIEMLRLVRIPEPEKRVNAYPHQLSGGMRQRVMIAIALSCKPKLLIADEPTTALDVTIQAQILELMKELRQNIGTSIMFITHNLGVVAEIADRVVLMYNGRVVEEGDVVSVFEKPLHPYTLGLINSTPKINGGKERLEVIKGFGKNGEDFVGGCSFYPRCRFIESICLEKEPPLREHQPGRNVACWLPDEVQTREKAEALRVG